VVPRHQGMVSGRPPLLVADAVVERKLFLEHVLQNGMALVGNVNRLSTNNLRKKRTKPKQLPLRNLARPIPLGSRKSFVKQNLHERPKKYAEPMSLRRGRQLKLASLRQYVELMNSVQLKRHD
jgi:hypothetical protein